jgi:hypothetical protein
MEPSMDVFGALKERFCAMECGCFPMGSEVFQHLLHEGEEQ